MKHYPTVYQTRTLRPTTLSGRGEVAILLALRNGSAYLGPQLASIARQNHRNWSLIVSDDGSTDRGPALIHGFALLQPAQDVTLCPGPGQGAARNFLSLLARVPAGAAFAAFADQDDVWYDDKLARAISRLADQPPGIPALYGARTLVTDARMRPLGPSPLFRRPPGFRNALVQSIAGGNTMVMNRAAIDLLREAAEHAGTIPAHDWWAYQVVTGAGGTMIYDPVPALLYRQHGANEVGANTSPRARATRLARLLSGDFGRTLDLNLAALDTIRHRLTPANRARLDRMTEMRAAPPRRHLTLFREAGAWRQSRAGQAALLAAVAAGRV